MIHKASHIESTMIISAFRAVRIFKPNDVVNFEFNVGSRKTILTSDRLVSYNGAMS